MWKLIGSARISGNDESPSLTLFGRTERGLGWELVPAQVQLRDLLHGLCKDSELRLLVLEALLSADRQTQSIERADAEQAELDSELIGDWIDRLDSEELKVVTHRHQLNGARYRFGWNQTTIYNRAVRKLPQGVGEATLKKILRRLKS